MIPTTFISELAQFTNTQIEKVVLNGSYEINTFRIKKVEAGIVELEYMIPAGSVAEVKLIELGSSKGQVVSSNEAYVPITSDTVIKHTVTVREV
ncbi:ketopantoate hydroxymethyltransferase [Paenibacillus sp. MZ04-78.2]|uniref:ketopantoate hydroxymethyltransferase n=1 Tax=Paenibacillus sp. MZ04-78.2 TaxID=2962034 RepID=UPI0020B84458|nr:ketopantoate hydroxymethyltransferase [Paenibacillus sp. MZ04-78.2]MCP3773666.1 ketopantoate hydroxymethyltransferase [Paenibacillus sp. MZ04-78.2]